MRIQQTSTITSHYLILELYKSEVRHWPRKRFKISNPCWTAIFIISVRVHITEYHCEWKVGKVGSNHKNLSFLHTISDRYLEYGKTHPWVFNHNTHLWRQCQIHKKICWDSRFVSKFCQLFPFQSMKLVRLRLRAAEDLLAKNRYIFIHIHIYIYPRSYIYQCHVN